MTGVQTCALPISGIYGLEEADGHRFLALQYVEGETLGQRLARGRLPLEEALEVCRQIASALESAHESGVIHRDLKPGNVKITPAGEVKVLDFGLAKGAPESASGSDPDLSHSPTLTYAATGVGVILGTAAYMSPEQARGKTVDKRTDIWSFGCVLYECLTGQQLFAGETVSDTIAKILEREPDWSALAPAVPASVRHVLQKCLEKDARKRLRDIGDARIELEGALAQRTSSAGLGVAPASMASPRQRSQLVLAWGAAGVFAVAAVVLAIPHVFRQPANPHAVRFTVTAPEGTTLVPDAAESAISPDGLSMVMTAVDSAGTSYLWVRPLDSFNARQLAGTDNASLPFWSPDGRFIGFFADGKLKKIPAGGGTAEVLCDANNGRGGNWSPNGVIIFAPAGQGPIVRVSANGGDTAPVTTLDSTRHETGHRFPCFLPDGNHFLYVALPAHQGKFDIIVGSLDGKGRRTLLGSSGGAIYAEPGHVLFLRNQTLMAQRFDPRSLRLKGEPVALSEVPGVSNYSGCAGMTASRSGVLAHLRGTLANTQLAWIDHSGNTVGTVAAPPGRYTGMALSPDGRRLAVTKAVGLGSSDVWLIDLERGVSTRFTFGPSHNEGSIWSPDGKRIAFESDREGPWDLYVKPVGGAGREEAVHKSKVLFKHPIQWSPDGRFLVYEVLDERTGWDLWVLPMDGDRRPMPYLQTPFNERFGFISPDGQWMSYTSDESGKFEVYAQSFPTADDKYQVSTGGGVFGIWLPDGKRMSFGTLDGQTMNVVDVVTSPRFHAGPPRRLFKLPPTLIGIAAAPDWSRILVSVPASGSTASSVDVVLNWTAQLAKP